MTAEQICSKVDARLKPQAVVLAEQVLFMADKLEETRKEIEKQSLAIPYDNGGGQTGIRENPTFVAYEKMIVTFTKSLSALSGMIGESAEQDGGSLGEFRNRFKAVAG